MNKISSAILLLSLVVDATQVPSARPTTVIPTMAPTGINYEAMFESAFTVPTSPPYNDNFDTDTGLTSSGYVDESRRRLRTESKSSKDRVSSLFGASPTPAMIKRLLKPAPPSGEGPPGGGGIGGNESPTVSSGWQIEFTGIPDYDHTITQDEIDTLNARPNADTDFTTGATTAVAGDYIAFGDDVGYVDQEPGCSLGYWPPGPECPDDYDGSYIFSMAPAPEESENGCYTGTSLGYLVNGVPFWSWSDTNTYNSEGVWSNLAGAFEQPFDMDICGGHAANTVYHHHAYPPCLADKLGDTGTGHSPVYGFAYDSYPLYGPWQSSGVLAVSCWKARDYSSSSDTGCSDSQRSCQLVDQYDVSQGTTEVADGPDIGSDVETMSSNIVTADSGIYFEDMYYDSDCSEEGEEYLDSHNGHSHGTIGYHYHITVSDSSSMTPTFPYTMGPKYYGCVRYGSCNSGYAVGSESSGDSVCGESQSTSSIPGEAQSDSKEKKQIPPGAIIGIVIAGVALLVLIGCLSYHCCCRKENYNSVPTVQQADNQNREVAMVAVGGQQPTSM